MSIYYQNPKYKLHNKQYPLYLCTGQRGRGKTSWWLQEMIVDSVETGMKFIYLRRTDVEMNLALEKGLYNGIRTIEENKPFWSRVTKWSERNGELRITIDGIDTVVGYYATLNNVKGISVEDCDKLLFDEYVAKKRSDYKGGEAGVHEPEIFCRLLDTLFRLRDFTCVLLGNDDTPSNPYNEYWHIPFGADIYKDKRNGVWYEYDYSDEMAEVKNNSTLGLITRGTNYNGYSQGLRSLCDIDETLIADKPSHAQQIYNIKMLSSVITVWLDRKTSVMYLTDKHKLNNTLTIVCVTNADMSVNSDFIRYNTMFLQIMKNYFGQGAMRFNSQHTASLFASMLSLQ